MIFVTFGTQSHDFSRPLKELDRLLATGRLKTAVIVQAGHTKYTSPHMDIRQFIPAPEMDELYERADLVITHGGVASIISGLRHQKPVIVLPRLLKFGEHINDHQIQIADRFAAQNLVIKLAQVSELASAVKRAKKMKFSKLPDTSRRLQKLITDFVDEL